MYLIYVEYIFNVVQNILMYIKCIGTSHEITKLQPILQLNKHKGMLLDEKPKKLVIMEGNTI
jgi:hypothetical protein